MTILNKLHIAGLIVVSIAILYYIYQLFITLIAYYRLNHSNDLVIRLIKAMDKKIESKVLKGLKKELIILLSLILLLWIILY